MINMCGLHHINGCWSVLNADTATTRHAICTVLTTQMELRARWASSLYCNQVAICVVYTTQNAFRPSCLNNLPNTLHAICTVLTTQMELRVRWASSLRRTQVAICLVYTTQVAFATLFIKLRNGCLCESINQSIKSCRIGH